jgi:hypothetical protein
MSNVRFSDSSVNALTVLPSMGNSAAVVAMASKDQIQGWMFVDGDEFHCTGQAMQSMRLIACSVV